MSSDDLSYFEEALKRTRAQIDDSGVFLALVTEHYLDSPVCWAQLGYAVLKDKPILLLVKRGTLIPDNLRRLARALEEFGSDEDMEFAVKRLEAVMEAL